MDLGQGFTPRFGKVTEQMPILRGAGETPVSVDMVLQKQFAHPETWGKTYVFTGVGFVTDVDGSGIIDKESRPLYGINGSAPLINHTLVLNDNQYKQVRYGSSSIHLSAREVAQAHGKGLRKVQGVWQFENDVVEHVWGYLTDGRDLREHAELASQKSNGVDQVMCLYFDQGEREAATLRPGVVGSLDIRSDVSGGSSLDDDLGRLVGVAPEALEQARSAACDLEGQLVEFYHQR